MLDRAGLRGLATGTVAAVLAELYVDLRVLRPFRAGNDEAIRVFLGLLADDAGYRIDWPAVPAAALTAAADTGDPDPLRVILQDAVHHTDTTGTGGGRKRREVHALADTLREVADHLRPPTDPAPRPAETGAHRPPAVPGHATIAAPVRPEHRELSNRGPTGQRRRSGVGRRAGSAAPDRGDPQPVAGRVLHQDRHELAGRVTVSCTTRCTTAGSSMLNCADSRCTTWEIAARSAREAGIAITYQRDRRDQARSIPHPVTPHNRTTPATTIPRPR